MWFIDCLRFRCWQFESILCWSVLPNTSQTCCDSNTATSTNPLGIRLSYVKRIRLQLFSRICIGPDIPSRSDPWSRVCFPCQQPGLLRKCESYKMPCPLPQMSVFLLRQGNSVLLLGPHPSFVVYWLFEVPLLTIWVNSVLICSSKYVYSQSKRPMEQMLTGYIYIYAFSRHFYPKRLTVHSAMRFWSVYSFAKSALVWPFSSRSDPSNKCTKCSVAKRS